MATSFGALCTDFYVNQKISVKMDLPTDRETILHLFDRVRSDHPTMNRFRRFPDELVLESSRQETESKWIELRRTSIRSGHVNPESLPEAAQLHELILKMVPFHLSISPLDIEYQELMFGFDLETKANQHEIVFDALFANTPLATLMDSAAARPLDVQPIFGLALNDKCDLQAYFDVKANTTRAQVKRGRYRVEPISILLTMRKLGPISKPEDLLANAAVLREHGERLATETLVPNLLMPIRNAIATTS